VIIITICKLLLAMIVGYYLNKKDVFSVEMCQKLSFFIVNITMPLLIITSLGDVEISNRGELIGFILVGAGFYAALPFLANLIVFVTNVNREDKPVYEMFYIFSNNMFMGYPVAAAIYGNSCIFHLSMFNLGFNLLYYTYGIRCVSGQKDGLKGGQALRRMVNPGTVASLLAIVVFFIDLQMPAAVSEICGYVGNVSSPLSMVIIGANIGAYSLKSVFADDRKLYFMSFIRLAVMPIAAYGVMTLLGFSGILRGIAVVTMGMPVASLVSMGCSEYGIYARLGSAGVVMTTVLSLVTIPILLIILG